MVAFGLLYSGEAGIDGFFFAFLWGATVVVGLHKTKANDYVLEGSTGVSGKANASCFTPDPIRCNLSRSEKQRST